MDFYSNGEKIYKSSNQSCTINPDAIRVIYDVFHGITRLNGYDFTTAGSNIKLFDNADEEYIIKDGFVRKNKLIEVPTGEKHTDFEEFNGVNSFMKKNYFTMTTYFKKESYSTCILMNCDKEKPKDE